MHRDAARCVLLVLALAGAGMAGDARAAELPVTVRVLPSRDATLPDRAFPLPLGTRLLAATGRERSYLHAGPADAASRFVLQAWPGEGFHLRTVSAGGTRQVWEHPAGRVEVEVSNVLGQPIQSRIRVRAAGAGGSASGGLRGRL